MSANASNEATVTMAFPPLPASPTLTNPDMILPYESNSYDDYDATDSRRYSNVPPSPPNLWKESRQPDMHFSFGVPLQSHMGQMTPTTPIIYGNGTMLSDIGEVTEVESTLDTETEQDLPQRRSYAKGSDLNMIASPTFGYRPVSLRAKVGTHERKVSSESMSTVTSRGQAAVFEEFGDDVSVDDSNFQGDDEESIIDETYQHGANFKRPRSLEEDEADEETDHGSVVGADDDDEYTSAALSRRAELILANAKQRLNSMEGNLSRARSSLYITPSASLSSINSTGSLPRASSSAAADRIVSQLGVLPSRHRQLSLAKAAPGSPGHTRVQSENNAFPGIYSTPLAARSSSALASPVDHGSTANGTSLQKSQSLETVRDEARGMTRGYHSSPLASSSSPFHSPLGPLKENDTPEVGTGLLSHRSSIQSFTSVTHSESQGGSRSTSSQQVRGLRDQMEDLKGRISSLRDRAREDSMRRRSLQSLRSPSPFTAAEQWYTSAKVYKDGSLSADAGVAHPLWAKHNTVEQGDEREPDVPWNGHGQLEKESTPEENRQDLITSPAPIAQHVLKEVEEEEDERIISDEEDVDRTSESTPVQRLSVISGESQHTEVAYDTASENEEEFEEVDAVNQGEDAEDDTTDDYDDLGSDDDASRYHDTVQDIISHEDREDAFDYEHFFLHSAMGTIGGRRDSISSEDSVETTKGPIADTSSQSRPSYRHSRQMSTDTLSTVATFQTATEGGDGTEEAEDDLIEDLNNQRFVSPVNGRSSTAMTARRDVITPTDSAPKSTSPVNPSFRHSPLGKNSALSRDLTSGHRPSVSSFGSGGTARSFPLVNKPKLQSEIKTYTPEPGLGLGSGGGAHDAVGFLFGQGNLLDENGALSPQLANNLGRDDQILIQRLVVSLEKCIQVLQEASRSGYEARLFRRRLDAARRILDGQEALV